LACVSPIFHGRHRVAALIDGRQLAGEVKGEVRRTIDAAMTCGGHRPGLAVVKVRDDPASAVQVRGKFRACEEVGTLYRANTVADVRKLAASVGFTVDRLERIEGRPEYLRITWLTYLVGAAYERVVNTYDFFAIFRILLIAQLRKPANDEPGIQS
jgi:hypothetical protein